jgi:hypothetical protein
MVPCRYNDIDIPNQSLIVQSKAEKCFQGINGIISSSSRRVHLETNADIHCTIQISQINMFVLMIQLAD